MKSSAPAAVEARQWLRLKDALADLAELAPEQRADALAALDLADADRRALADMMLALDPADQRLRSPQSGQARAPLSALRWQIGDVVNAYVIDGLLGRGGMGEVYAAHAQQDGARVALKVLRLGLEQSGLDHFVGNEQRALRRLDDAHIARFIDAFELPTQGVCLVLEHVDGEPLMDWCERQALDADARLALFQQICSAVASAHQQLVVHRDLKPGNVLVTGTGQVKLLDFGIAKLLDEDAAATQTQGGLYTLEYAAPEQVLRNPVSTATDIYALGALLFHLLTDASPYVTGAHESLVKAVLSDKPRSLASAETEAARALKLDRDLDRVIARAMEKDPRDRYRSAIELAADVQAIRDGVPISAGGGRAYRLRKFVRRHPAGVAMSAVLLLTLLIATGVSLYWAQQADAQARIAAGDARRATAANDFLLAVLDLNDRFSRRNSGDLTLTQVLDRAVLLARTELADEPEVRADVLSKLSVALQRRGEQARALALANEALEILTQLPDRDAEAYAAALRRVGSIEVDLNQLEPAQQHLAEAIRVMDSLATDHRKFTISAMTSLARIASARGDPQSALRIYESIVQIRASLDGDNRADAAMDYSNLGAAWMFLSKFDEAAMAYTKAIELLRATLGDQHPRLGLIRGSYATVLLQLGRLDDARRELAAARQLMANSSEPSERNRYQTIAELNLAGVDYWQGDYAAGLERLLAAEAMVPATHLGGFLLWRGRFARAQGDNNQATTHFAAAEAQAIEAGGAAHPRRWLARGLAAIAASEVIPGQIDSGALQEALDALAKPNNALGAERTELLLQSGAAARRRGELTLALEQHRQCDEVLRKNGWLGDLGRALIDGELALDRLATMADASQRAPLFEPLDRSIEVLGRLSPGSVSLQEFRAARR